MLSRVLIPLFGLLVWFLFYLNVRCVYRLPKSGRKTVTQLSLILAAVGIFVVQVNLMNYLAPSTCRWRFRPARVCDPGAGEGQVLRLLEFF